jgi:hypothetical protein
MFQAGATTFNVLMSNALMHMFKGLKMKRINIRFKSLSSSLIVLLLLASVK